MLKALNFGLKKGYTIGGNEWFTLSSFLGGENFDWQGTPLQILYEKHFEQSKDREKAEKNAAQSAGHILKQVLYNDKKRSFEIKNDRVRWYRWMGLTKNEE